MITINKILTKINNSITSIKESLPSDIEVELDENALKDAINETEEESILVEVYVSVPENNCTYIDMVSNKLFDEIGEYTINGVGYDDDELYNNCGVIRFCLDRDMISF